MGNAFGARVSGGTSAASLDCARHRSKMDRHGEPGSGLRGAGRYWLAGWPLQPADADVGSADFRRDPCCVGSRSHRVGQYPLARSPGGPFIQGRRRRFQLVGFERGGSNALVRLPVWGRNVEPAFGRPGVDRQGLVGCRRDFFTTDAIAP